LKSPSNSTLAGVGDEVGVAVVTCGTMRVLTLDALPCADAADESAARASMAIAISGVVVCRFVEERACKSGLSSKR
jgi:hypothetical protein